jgi:hypothetical protein
MDSSDALFAREEAGEGSRRPPRRLTRQELADWIERRERRARITAFLREVKRD